MTVANFGTPLHATEAVEAGFTERTREYTTSADATADADLGTAAKAVVAAHFAQTLHTNSIKIGRKDVAEQQKELLAEAKGRGYDTKVMKKVIALRKRKPDEIAEEQAVLDMYMSALGMTETLLGV